MKKLLIPLLLLCLTITVNAQLTYSSNIELGYESFGYSVQSNSLEPNARYISPWLITANLNFGVHYKGFSLVNEVETYFNYLSTDTYSFNVYFINYKLDFYYKYDRYQLGYKHNCFHSIYSSYFTLIENYTDRFYLKVTIN